MTKHIVQSINIDLRENYTFNETYTNANPDNPVPNSILVSVDVSGQLLPSEQRNDVIDIIIINPNGTADVILHGLAIDVVAAEYLKIFTNSTPQNLLDSLNYPFANNRLTMYQNANGGFYINVNSPSVWSTAFAVRIFNRIKTYVTVNQTIITNANKFLTNNQNTDGTFKEPNAISQSYLQGASKSGLSFNIYVALALIESDQILYKAQYTKTVTMLSGNNINSSDPIALAMYAYLLQIIKHPSRSTYMNRLISSAKVSSGYVWWEVNGVSGDPKLGPTSTSNVEATAYACLAIVLSNQVINSQYVGKWLSQTINLNSDNENTQAVIMGLEAINKVTTLVGSTVTPRLTVAITTVEGTTNINVNQSNLYDEQVINVSNLFNISSLILLVRNISPINTDTKT